MAMNDLRFLEKVGSDDSCNHILNFIVRNAYSKPSSIKSGDENLAFVFFLRHAMTSRTLRRILWPKPFDDMTVIRHNLTILDAVSPYSILRSMYESFLICGYLLNRSIDPLERELRYLIWDRSSFYDRVKGGQVLKTKKEVIRPFEVKLEEKTKELLSNRRFNECVSEKQKKKIIEGRERRLKNFTEIAREMRINENYHSHIYKSLSSYTHPNALGIDHFIHGDPQFQLNMAKFYYEQISALLLHFFGTFLLRDEMEKDDFIMSMIYYHTGLVNNFDEINQLKY